MIVGVYCVKANGRGVNCCWSLVCCPSLNLYYVVTSSGSCAGSLVVLVQETTVSLLVLEASVATVEAVTLEAMEETVASVEVRRLYFHMVFITGFIKGVEP